MADVKFTVRMESDLHEVVVSSSRKNHRSLNGEIVHSLRNRRWTDSDLLDFATEALRLPPNPPYLLENKDLRMSKLLQNFKQRRQ